MFIELSLHVMLSLVTGARIPGSRAGIPLRVRGPPGNKGLIFHKLVSVFIYMDGERSVRILELLWTRCSMQG